ncbi:MAG TPA: hypothetical protein VHA56_00050 [Mucilaginibacter sp.]|nr:hypothetical protein [Mucilaginibacter sp.]
MTNYKDKLGGLADKLKTTPLQAPIQKVQPVKAPAPDRATEVQFNNWIPKTLLKRLKTFCIEHEQSLKACNIEALELLLATKTKNT